jgi:hypothetical protein
MKYCKYCKKFLDENEFYQYRNICKNCYLEKRKKYYQLNYQLNPEKWIERNKKWQRENPEKFKEAILQGNIRWRKRNPEKFNECHRKWCNKNPDKVYKSVRKWQKNHPEYMREQKKKYELRHPEKKREQRRISRARRRKKGYIPIMINPFPSEINIDMHHIRPNLPFVLPLPTITHRYELKSIEKHVEFNDYWIKKIYSMDNTFFSEILSISPQRPS